MNTRRCVIDSQLGELTVVADGSALTGETRVSGTEAARFISGLNCRCL
jgi:hypothetical protein